MAPHWLKAWTAVEGVDGDTHINVEVTTIDLERKSGQLPPPDFVKMDIEGFEYPALIGMKDTISAHHPTLYIEMHGHDRGAKFRNAEQGVNLLMEHGYRLKHVESGTDLTKQNWQTTAEGHVYAWV